MTTLMRVVQNLRSTAKSAGGSIMEWLCGIRAARGRYAEIRQMIHGGAFVDKMLNIRNVVVQVSRHETIRIPRTGGCIVVANHPLGAVDGVAMIAEMIRIRPDVRVIANEILAEVEELRSYIIPVNVISAQAAAANVVSMRAAVRHLKSGGLLIAFPAGEVSSAHVVPPGIRDRRWSAHMAAIAQRTDATIVPAFIHARNSMMFYVAGLVHPRLRTLLLVWEMLRYKNKTIRIVFGNPVRMNDRIRAMSAEALSDLMRFRSDFLRFKNRESMVSSDLRLEVGETIIEEVPAYRMMLELEKLHEGSRLVETDDFMVFTAEMRSIPCIMQEVGRLREVTYRLVGEGSGKSCDIDVFDSMYTHVIVWHKEQSKIAGAYRIGHVDELLSRYGRNGLYTNTLFKMSDETLQTLACSLELGRSFVRPEFQRDPSVLYLLLKGIGIYVKRHPKCRYLIGPVSIGNSYTETSKRLILNSLLVHHYNRSIAKGVKSNTSLEVSLFRNWDCLLHSKTLLPISELDTLVRDAEPEGKSIPVLLKHYLSLGGKVIGFNRDASFGNCIDAFIMVDLCNANEAALRRYLGVDGIEHYRNKASTHGEKGLESIAA